MLSYNAKLNSCTTQCHCNSSHDHSGHVKSLVDSLRTVLMLASKPWLTLYGSDYVLTECSRVLGYIQGLGLFTTVAVVQMGMTVWLQVLTATSLKIMQRLHSLQLCNQEMEHQKKRPVRRPVTNRGNRNSQTDQLVPQCSVLNMHHQPFE